MEKPTIFLTGATGLLGSHLLVELVKSKKNIMVLVRDEVKAKQTILAVFSWYGLTEQDLKSYVFFVKGDITDVDLIDNCLQNMDIVFHCAGKISLFDEDKWDMLKINGEGTANIVNCCLSNSVKQLLYVSSISTVNKGFGGEINEELFTKEDTFLSAYAISKRAGENEVWRGIEEGLQAVIINPTIIIGPDEKQTGSIALFYKVRNGMRYITKGVAGFVDVRDVVNISIQLIENKIVGQRFIVSAENLSFENFVNKIALALHIKTKFKIAPFWLLKMVVLINSLLKVITGKKYLPNSALLKMVGNKGYYSNEKIKAALNYKFYAINEAIENTTSKLKLKV
jgi:dihydroflavonol-4-reductase